MDRSFQLFSSLLIVKHPTEPEHSAQSRVSVVHSPGAAGTQVLQVRCDPVVPYELAGHPVRAHTSTTHTHTTAQPSPVRTGRTAPLRLHARTPESQVYLYWRPTPEACARQRQPATDYQDSLGHPAQRPAQPASQPARTAQQIYRQRPLVARSLAPLLFTTFVSVPLTHTHHSGCTTHQTQL